MTHEQLRAYRTGLDDLLGLRLVEASGARVIAFLEVGERHLQPTGIVHGGVYATMVETVASVGATLAQEGAGYAIGLSNHTDFLRAAQAGAGLTAVGVPLQSGRTIQLWQVEITDDDDRLVAHGRVHLINRAAEGSSGWPPRQG